MPLVLRFTGSKEVMWSVNERPWTAPREQLRAEDCAPSHPWPCWHYVVFEVKTAVASNKLLIYQMSCCFVIPLTLDNLSKECSEKTLSHGVASVATFLRNGIIAKAEKDQSDNFSNAYLVTFRANVKKQLSQSWLRRIYRHGDLHFWRRQHLSLPSAVKTFLRVVAKKREFVYIATSRMIEFVTAGSFQRLAVTIRWNMNLVCSLRLHPYSPFAASHDHIIEQFMRPFQKKTPGKWISYQDFLLTP